MSTDRDVTRIVRSWLEEGATALPDRVLDTVLDQLPATPQRRAWWPARRSNPMNLLRIAMAAAAVVVIAVVGINLMPNQGVGPPVSTPSAVISPTTSASPSASGDMAVPGPDLMMAPGTYLIQDPFPLRVRLTVGKGWASWSGNVASGAAIYKGSPDFPGGLGLVVVIVDNVYADACDPAKGLLDPPLGSTVADLAEALSNQPRTAATAPTDVTVDGFSGSYLEYSATTSTTECPNDLTRWPTVAGPREALTNEHDRVWIVDVDGTRLVIDAFSFPDTTAADQADLQAVVDSIQIEPPTAGSSPSPLP